MMSLVQSIIRKLKSGYSKLKLRLSKDTLIHMKYIYELDKEQERFLELYLRYKESCEKVGDACREAVEFDSLQELEEEINSRNDMLNRLKDRSALLEELRKESGSDDVARELYIC